MLREGKILKLRYFSQNLNAYIKKSKIKSAVSFMGENVKEIKDKVKDLCDILQQDCIAILIDNYQGKLIYNKRHLKQVPKLKFDSDLFIDAYNKDNFNKNFK